jgi:uncharacterized phage protein gp47/JayE
LTLAQVDLSDPAPVQVSIRAANDQDGNGGRGEAGNLSVGDTVTFISPLPNVQVDTIVASVTTTGVDAEDWEIYRGRVLDGFRSQPQGGAYVDYRKWATMVSGIIQAYVYTGDPGRVEVYSEAETTALNPDGIPSSGQLDEVKAAIEYESSGLATRRPIGAYVESKAISRSGIDVTISSLSVSGSQAEVETKIQIALDAYFRATEPYISGLSLGARRDRITKASIGGIVQDTVVAYNGVFDEVNFEVLGVAQNIYILGKGEKAKLSTVAFV